MVSYCHGGDNMTAKEVLRILGITRQTLTKYVKTEVIRVNVLPNGRYDYNEEDVYKFLNKGVNRKTYIYARVSTSKQKKDFLFYNIYISQKHDISH